MPAPWGPGGAERVGGEAGGVMNFCPDVVVVGGRFDVEGCGRPGHSRFTQPRTPLSDSNPSHFLAALDNPDPSHYAIAVL